MGGRKWSVEEDAICCKVCVEEYVIKKSYMDIETCISHIRSYPEIKDRGSGSIRMKISNIKYLFTQWKIPNTLYSNELEHASQQNILCLKACLEARNISIMN